MEHITQGDLLLINKLSKYSYSDNKLLSKASEEEKEQLNRIKKKLKEIAIFFSNRYNDSYGPFETSVVTGNDIAIGGTRFKRIWSGIFKGAENKQYAAQISFVLDPDEACLDVGFYFGRAQGHSKNKEERQRLEEQLRNLGVSLSNSIKLNNQFKEKYTELFDFGFTAHSEGQNVTAEQWIDLIANHTKSSQIIAKIRANDFGVIESSTIDSYVSQIIFLMGGISADGEIANQTIKPLTPEQRAKQAERLAEIGTKGELFVMKMEKERLLRLGLNNPDYPQHIALESVIAGYDILSLNEQNEEIFIEVKTTTRKKSDEISRRFFISRNEFEIYKRHKSVYKLYRVYDIENNPHIEMLDLENMEKEADGYICTY